MPTSHASQKVVQSSVNRSFCFVQVYGFDHVDLIPDGSEREVTLDNVEQYLTLTLEFYLGAGIRRQLTAFRGGFNGVFAIEKLQSFSPDEIQVRI